jgi:hypothetical protein
MNAFIPGKSGTACRCTAHPHMKLCLSAEAFNSVMPDPGDNFGSPATGPESCTATAGGPMAALSPRAALISVVL